MKLSTVFRLSLVLLVSSCSDKTAKVDYRTSNAPNSNLESKTGLLINNGINRGINYTDSLGAISNLRYIPITITNDTTIAIHVQVEFSNEYDYPHTESGEKFKLIPLPEEWAQNGGEITDRMVKDLKNHIDKPILHKTLEPGDKIVLGIGTLYPRPPKFSGVLPNKLFAAKEKDVFSECNWTMNEKHVANNAIPLMLKLDFSEICLIIACGQVSYTKH